MTEEKAHARDKERLALLATRLRTNLDQLKRPVLIEFSGTPKAGKTTCVEAIARFFRRHEIPVHVVMERASVCPIVDKHHLFFNTWTATTSLAQMLEALGRGVSIVILDRGVFDSLVWMDFLHRRHAVSAAELEAIERFVLLDRWANRIDVVVALSVDPKEALEREFRDQITDVEGSIMNPQNLAEYNTSLERCRRKYSHRFRKIMHLDTSGKQPREGVAAIAYELITKVDELVDEQVAVVDYRLVAEFMPPKGVLEDADRIGHFMHEVVRGMTWLRRSQAEENAAVVQLVPVAVLSRCGEILTLKIRGETQGGTLTDRRSIWAGGHARLSDLPRGAHTKTIFRRALIRELDEELHINPDLQDVALLPSAVVWDQSEPRSVRHLGLFFVHDVPESMPKEVLHQREFWETPRKSLFTEYRELDGHLAMLPDWEAWSILYLRELHGISFPVSDQQRVLF